MDECMQENLLNPTPQSVHIDLKEKAYQESKKIWRVALPSIISRVTSFGTIVVTQSFIGHINSTHLAAYALVQTLIVRFVNGIVVITILINTVRFVTQNNHENQTRYIFIILQTEQSSSI